MLVEISATGDVEELHLGRQRETPEYLYGIDEWLRSVKGLPARELCYDCPDSASRVDAFTGATVTGEAVVAIVRCFASPEGDEAALRKAGKMRLEGKEYLMQDGDVVHYRFNV